MLLSKAFSVRLFSNPTLLQLCFSHPKPSLQQTMIFIRINVLSVSHKQLCCNLRPMFLRIPGRTTTKLVSRPLKEVLRAQRTLAPDSHSKRLQLRTPVATWQPCCATGCRSIAESTKLSLPAVGRGFRSLSVSHSWQETC